MPKKKDKDSMSPKKEISKKAKTMIVIQKLMTQENEEYNDFEFHKMLSSMFPSKMQNEKVKKKEVRMLKKNTKTSKKRKLQK